MTDDLTPTERAELDALEAEMGDLFSRSAEVPSAETRARLYAVRAIPRAGGVTQTGSRSMLALAALLLLGLVGLMFAVQGAGEAEPLAAALQHETSGAVEHDDRAPIDDAEHMDEAIDDLPWLEGDWPQDEGAFAEGLDLLNLPPLSPHAEENLDALEDALEDLEIDA